jgi:uncharacterized protein with HEPN domain
MPRRELHRLRDILTAIAEIRTVVEGTDRAGFLSDFMRCNSVAMSILVISESVRHLPGHIQALRPEIPWADVVGIGNIIRHTYFRVDHEALWTIGTTQMEALEEAIRAILADIET